MDWHDAWADRGRRAAGGLLALAALGEAIVRGGGVESVLALAVLGLCTMVPLAYLGPVAAAVCISLAAVLSLAAFGTLTVAGLVAELIVLYWLGWDQGGRRPGGLFLAPLLAGSFVILALVGPRSVLVVLLAALAPAAALTGIARRAQVEAHMHIAARQVVADTMTERTARGERAHISRELHDVVAHHISMIAVQAETARLVTPGMPAAGAQRLREISDTARAGLTEMRRLLGVLREDAGPWHTDLHPQPGLRQLNDLLDAAREASGAGTRLILSGPPAALDPGVELAAYRIVQEALTNSLRHAPGAAVDVELHFTDRALRLRVRDNGPGPPGVTGPEASGHGVTGMRERATAAGGELRTGTAAGGGFVVEATLPAKGSA